MENKQLILDALCSALQLTRVMVARWDGNGWEQMYQHEYLEDDVIAWMPLPEPYKGGEQDG